MTTRCTEGGFWDKMKSKKADEERSRAPVGGSMFFIMETSTGKIDFETSPQRWKKDCYKPSDGYEWCRCALVPMPSNDKMSLRSSQTTQN